MRSLTQISPVTPCSLRGPASVSFEGKTLAVVHHRLISYHATKLNGRVIDSPFAGALYFKEQPPGIVRETLTMMHEGSEITLHDCKSCEGLEEAASKVEGLVFGIEFSYATTPESMQHD